MTRTVSKLRQYIAPVIALLVVVAASAEPMHIYLTYSGAPETSIDINIIEQDKGKVESVDVHYDTQPRGDDPAAYAFHAKAEYVPTTMELSDRRSMYVARLTDLKPDTVYYFIAGEKTYGMSRERKFKTLPGGDKPIRIVDGGDMGADGKVIPLLTLAGKENPDFAVLGGDIAYVNGLLGGFATWDAWLKNWDQLMVTTDGRMIPITTAIGNHETNRFQSDEYRFRAPWYTSLFGRQGENIFYSRQYGNNLVIFYLDSGHLVPHADQVEWLKQEMTKYSGVKYKFAAYHVPLYPAHRDYEGGGSVEGRTHWLPVFDQFGLTVGMEHHDHVFKRSKPLKNGEVVKKGGTVYIGDGCFGRPGRTVMPETRWYNEKETVDEHFWVIDVAKRNIKFRAIDEEGKEIDSFTIKGR